MPQVSKIKHVVYASDKNAPDSAATDRGVFDDEVSAIVLATELVHNGCHKVTVESRAVVRLARITVTREAGFKDEDHEATLVKCTVEVL